MPCAKGTCTINVTNETRDKLREVVCNGNMSMIDTITNIIDKEHKYMIDSRNLTITQIEASDLPDETKQHMIDML